MKMKTLCALAIMGCSMSVAASASAKVINLSAITAAGPTPTAANGVRLDLAAGDYTISAVKGLYTAAQLAFGGDYFIPFTVSYTGFDELYYNASDNSGGYQAGFSTPDAALKAFQTGPVWEQDGAGANPPVKLSGPITLDLAQATSVNFSVTDYGQTYDNSEGVSLSVDRVSAAPEPSAWMLMIAGVGLTGCALRRRSQAMATA